MLLIEDDRQKIGQHETKNEMWFETGWRVVRARLPFGDYMIVDENDMKPKGKCRVDVHFPFGWMSFNPLCAVDTKKDIAELATNIINDHARFRAECIKAQDSDCNLVILIESGEVMSLQELAEWTEPEFEFLRRNGKQRRSGKSIADKCLTMSKRYGVRFAFCTQYDSWSQIINILERGTLWMKGKLS